MTMQKINDGLDLATTGRSLPIALLRTREAVMDRFRPMLKTHGVTEQQWRIMRILREAGPNEASQLAKIACVLGPSLSRIIKTLEGRKFIETLKDARDGRKTHVKLTPAGDAFLRALTPQSAAAFGDIVDRVGKDRIENLLNELNFVLEQLNDT
ncbi:MAG: homoprotocatechuate degradation operon regulator HpaR [Yoonia sp.]|nr:homoprotocatechuate degradation operon regulator HpaR [Yoonia sp.]